MPMNPVSAAEMASIRADAASTLALSCVIQRATKVRNQDGFETETWGTVATVMAGMKEPTAGQLQLYADAIGTLAIWAVNTPYGTDVRKFDHLMIGAYTLTVQIVLTPQGYDALTTALVSEVRS